MPTMSRTPMPPAKTTSQDELEPLPLYQPVPRGLELKIGEKLNHLAALDRHQPQTAEKVECSERFLPCPQPASLVHYCVSPPVALGERQLA